MSKFYLGRRAKVLLSFDGVDISGDVNKYLNSVSYTDSADGKADDLQVTLDDIDGIWISNWLEGDRLNITSKLSCSIILENYKSDGMDDILECGIFEIDTVDFSQSASSAPSVSLKGTSVFLSSSFKSEEKSRTFAKVNLSGIVSRIASEGGYKILFDAENDPYYESVSQYCQSDVVFLQGLCDKAGITLKASNNMLIFFDREKYEKADVVAVYKNGDADISSIRFSASASEQSYSKCVVTYENPETGKVITASYTPQDADPSMPVLEINEKVSTYDEAHKLAVKRYKQKSKEELSCSMECAGNVLLLSGMNIELSGYGKFSGKWAIESATHSVSKGGGYRTSAKLYKILDEQSTKKQGKFIEGEKVYIIEGALYGGASKQYKGIPVPKWVTSGGPYTITTMKEIDGVQQALIYELYSWVEEKYLKKER